MPPSRRRAAPPTVAVIGGGFSGLLTAIHLLHGDPQVRVRLVERGDRFALGRAYSTENPEHLLNVRVANMSAFPDQPHHFADWLAASGQATGDQAFVSRRRYGEYLQSLLRDHVSDPCNAGRLFLEQDEAVDLVPTDGGFEVLLGLGRRFEADAAVLAIGAPSPTPLPGFAEAALTSPVYFGDPWSIDPDDVPSGDILLIGSGLTTVDVALSLARPDRRLTALSRHGQLPRSHGPADPAGPPQGATDTPLSALRALRRHAAEVGWRSAVDSVRPQSVAIWSSWSLDQRRQFLRHGQTLWDVHRHRMAPKVAERVTQLVAQGELEILAGRLRSVARREGGGLEVGYAPHGVEALETRVYAAAINCTGFRPSFDPHGHDLISRLLSRKLARPDALGLGLDAFGDRRLAAADGRAVAGLYAVGVLTRAVSWEAVAAPDLRFHTAGVATAVLAELAAGDDTARREQPAAPAL